MRAGVAAEAKHETRRDRGSRVAETLMAHSPDLCVAVHCGSLEPVLCELERDHGWFAYVSRGDNAVAFAAGNALAGKASVVLMASSGLEQSVNTMESLVKPFGLPVGFVIGMEDSADAGGGDGSAEGVERDFARIAMPWRNLAHEDTHQALSWFESEMAERSGPAALLVPPDFFGWLGALAPAM